MPEHFLNLPGAATLATRSLQLVERDLRDIIANQAMGVVHGPAGTGKTFAVDVALERFRRAPAGDLPRPKIVTLVFPHAPTMQRVARDIANTLMPWLPTSRRANRFEIQEIVLEELSVAPYLLVVDEAQRLTRHAMEVLRFFYDNRDTRLALLLVGGDGCWQVISREPMLVSRVFRHRQFTPLPAHKIPEFMRGYHSLYRDADPGLLTQVDAEFAHGNWRNWVSFTATARGLAADSGRETLDAELVANTYTSLGYDEPDA